jgi:hypothetical protein
MLKLRRYRKSDITATSALFSVHAVCAKGYSPGQLDA